MANAINSLSAGSGIDVAALTQQLIAAEREPRQKLLDQRLERVEARISAQGQFRTALDGMVSALAARINSGALAGIPSVSDNSILGLTISPGSIVPSQSIEVRQLASFQALASAPITDPLAGLGSGTLTFAFGTVAGTTEAGAFTPGPLASLQVDIASGQDTLEGIRTAINAAAQAAGAPIDAQIVSDAQGSRLVLRGASGANQGFTITATGDPGLQAFAFAQGIDGGMSRTQAAQDTLVALDGLELARSSTVITDLIPGATLNLLKAAPGQSIRLSGQRDKAMISQTIQDVGDALNELAALGKQLTGSVSSAGALMADSATRRTLQQLQNLASTSLIPASGLAPTRLNDIGITLDRYGNFIIDEVRMTRAAELYPAQVEQILTALNAPATYATPAGPLRQLAEDFKLAAEGSVGNPTALQREKTAIAKAQTALNDKLADMEAKYKRSFGQLDVQVGKYKALQSYMQQQVDLWTKDRS